LEEGQRTIKKDSSGFQTMKLNARHIDATHDPYVFPCAVSQVFFMTNRLQPDWRVVIQYETQSRRRVDENHYIVFGAGGAAEEEELIAATVHTQTSTSGGDEIDNAAVTAVDAETTLPEQESYLGNLQYAKDEDEE
jgi:hypothetical protein